MKLKHKKEGGLQKGITLIALVITIIVLLILAGVSIATITGDNGILTKAQTAKTETEKASEEEQIQLAALNAAMNTKKYDYKVEDGTVPIPAGFAPTQIEGENTVENGFVIVDSKGNEFVWIPVTLGDNYVRNPDYVTYGSIENWFADTKYLPDDLRAKVTVDKTEEIIEKETVINAGGFYISRYEAGKGDNSTLISKKGATVWYYIAQEDCKKEAKKFINNNDVKSGLITGIQWDMVMNFINNKKDGNGNTFNVKTKNASRHTGSLAKSGQNPADKVCNIYDLEGNYNEFIAEKNNYLTDYSYVIRGGYCQSKFGVLASYRQENNGIGGGGTSFRFVLYVI